MDQGAQRRAVGARRAGATDPRPEPSGPGGGRLGRAGRGGAVALRRAGRGDVGRLRGHLPNLLQVRGQVGRRREDAAPPALRPPADRTLSRREVDRHGTRPGGVPPLVQAPGSAVFGQVEAGVRDLLPPDRRHPDLAGLHASGAQGPRRDGCAGDAVDVGRPEGLDGCPRPAATPPRSRSGLTGGSGGPGQQQLRIGRGGTGAEAAARGGRPMVAAPAGRAGGPGVRRRVRFRLVPAALLHRGGGGTAHVGRLGCRGTTGACGRPLRGSIWGHARRYLGV